MREIPNGQMGAGCFRSSSPQKHASRRKVNRDSNRSDLEILRILEQASLSGERNPNRGWVCVYKGGKAEGGCANGSKARQTEVYMSGRCATGTKPYVTDVQRTLAVLCLLRKKA